MSHFSFLLSLKYALLPSYRKLWKGCSLHAYDLRQNVRTMHTRYHHVLYAEGSYDAETNAFINSHFGQVDDLFDKQDVFFIYTPVIQRWQLRMGITEYYAPYAAPSQFTPTDSSWMFDHTPNAAKKANIGPTLLFNIPGNETALVGISLDHFHELDDKQRIKLIKMLAHRIRHFNLRAHSKLFHEFLRLEKEATYYSSVGKSEYQEWEENEFSKHHVKYSRRGNYRWEADDVFDEESRVLLEEIYERIQKLRQTGISREALVSMLGNCIEEEKPSRLRIDSQYRIWLTDYRNMEVKMTPLVKAVYLLFLSHPEGIVFKCLPDHREELAGIYRDILGVQALTAEQQDSIARLTDPFENSINEKCARIREAFVSIMDAHLCQKYVVDGQRGHAKRISLDRNLVFWD